MPTRPVTWELDVPPASLLGPAGKKPPAREVPSLHKLRKSLVGARFEVVKVSAFAIFLLAFVGIAIHQSRLATADNQYGANAGAAIKDLAMTISRQTVSMRARTETFAVAAKRRIHAMVERAPSLPSLPSSRAAVRPAAAPAVKQAAQVVRIPPQVHFAQSVHLDTAKPQSHLTRAALRDVPLMLKNLVTPDSLAAGVVGLLFYSLFAVVLVRKKGGLRAFS
jgi:hypothetical protein